MIEINKKELDNFLEQNINKKFVILQTRHKKIFLWKLKQDTHKNFICKSCGLKVNLMTIRDENGKVRLKCPKCFKESNVRKNINQGTS